MTFCLKNSVPYLWQFCKINDNINDIICKRPFQKKDKNDKNDKNNKKKKMTIYNIINKINSLVT